MKVAFFIIFFIILLIFINLEPKIVVDKEIIDIGKIDSEIKIIPVKIRNSGLLALKINKIIPSCDCLSTKNSNLKISGFRSRYLKIQLDATGKIGKLEFSVKLFSNDKNNPEKVLKIKANAKPSVYFNENFVYLDNVPPCKTTSKKILINSTKKNIKFNKFISNSKYFYVSSISDTSHQISQNSNFTIKIFTKPPLPEKIIKSQIISSLKNNEKIKLKLNIIANVKPPVIVRPAQLRINKSDKRQIEREIKITSGSIDRFKITKVISPLKNSINYYGNYKYGIKLLIPENKTDYIGKKIIIETDINNYRPISVIITSYPEIKK